MRGGILVVRDQPGPAADAAAATGRRADLVLRAFEPPAIQVRGKDLATLLTPAYRRLAGQDEADG